MVVWGIGRIVYVVRRLPIDDDQGIDNAMCQTCGVPTPPEPTADLHGQLERAQNDLDAARRAMAQMREEAEQAERFKREFMANVSHEIRTPMNAILGFSRLLMREPLAGDQLEKLRYVHDAADSLMRLIENLLDFSKLSPGKLSLEASPFHLDTVLGEVLQSARPAAQHKGLAVFCHTEEAAPRWLRGDRGRFRQVLNNLVDNAVKFTESGTVHIQTTVDESNPSAVTLRVAVTDTGVGIPSDQQARVFQSFSQADGSTTRRFHGVGLGLSICRQLVDLMGGQIGFRSAPSRGSTFWFTASFEKSEPQGTEAAGETTPQRDALTLGIPGNPLGHSASQQRRAAHILVADDDRHSRILLEALLSRAECLVDLAGNGREALAALASHDYDLAFMDVEMPEMDGLEATRRIRQEESDVGRPLTIVALTACAEPGDRQRCLAAGADDYLAKPFTADSLWEVVQRHLPGVLEALNAGPSARSADLPMEPGELERTLADCARAMRSALERPELQEVETHARTVKNLATQAKARAVADEAVRVQLAARRGDAPGTASAVERLDRALRNWLALRRAPTSLPCH